MRYASIIISLFLFSVSAEAQNKFKGGFRGGANFANITQTGLSTRTDFYISGVGELKLNKFYALQPEFGYTRQGAKGLITSKNGVSPSMSKIQANYVTLGVINKLYFTDNFNFLLGPSIEQQLDQSPYLKRSMDLAFSVGMEVITPFGLGIEARLKKGILDVLDSRNFEFPQSSSNNWFTEDINSNLVMQVGLVYRIGNNN